MVSTRIHTYFFIFVVSLIVCIWGTLSFPVNAYAERSDELYAEAESILKQVDELQSAINEENARYEHALAQRDEALTKAQEAQENIDEQQKRMDFYHGQLATLVTEMYKNGESSSILDVILEAETFEEFLTKWDSFSSVSGKGAELIKEAKIAKAAFDEAKSDYENQSEIASSKMNEAEKARKSREKKQAELRQKAEELTKEAAEARAQEELQREAARQAAIAAEEILKAEKSKKDSKDDKKEGAEEESHMTGSLVLSGSGILNHPLPSGVPSSPFGWRDLDGGTFHMGFDLAAPEGTPYYAAASGTVVYATNDGGYNGGAGNWIVISHGDGLVTIYMHSSEVYVKPGDTVKRGQKIGAVGNTGHSYGAHLHFQLEYNGVAIDPAPFI